MTLLAVVQARMGSERLPGKVLKPVGDRTILEWVIHRAENIPADIDRLVVATSARAHDDPIAEICAAIDIDCYRSSEHDVLNRFQQTAIHYKADAILRVTADCPLLDPDLNHDIIETFTERPCDYVAAENVPDGFGQEIFSASCLDATWRHAVLPEDREHVVPFMLTDNGFTCLYVQPPELLAAHADLRFTIDWPEDYRRLCALHELYGDALFDLGAAEILADSRLVFIAAHK